MSNDLNKINCQQVRGWLPAGLTGELSTDEQLGFDKHVAQCEVCRSEIAVTRQLQGWMHSSLVPNPSSQMQVRFDQMLDAWEEDKIKPSLTQRLRKFWKVNWQLTAPQQIAFGSIMLLVGILAGYGWRHEQPSSLTERRLDSMARQMGEMQQMMMLTLLEHPSATERLQAVSMSVDLPNANQQVINALLTTLRSDPNTNVRLVALDALTQYIDDPTVREGLIQSLAYQDVPLVQLALADLMVKLEEKRSLQSLRQLLRRRGLQPMVKTKLEQSIRSLS